MAISRIWLENYRSVSFNIHPTQGCFYLKMLLFCYGHPCIYESFCCHMLICTIIVFDIANYCMSSDGKRLSSLKKKKQANNHSRHTETLGNLQFPDPVEQVLFPVPTIHPLQLPPALSGQDVTGRHSGENPAWIATVRCTVQNFIPYLFLLHNFQAMHGKFFFQKFLYFSSQI